MVFCELNEFCKTCCCADGPSLLSELSEESRKFLYEGKQEIVYSKGETILKQHTRVNHLICLKEGYIKVYTEGVNGKSLVRKIMKPGEMAGGIGLFVDEKHHFTACALTEVQCCLISADRFKELLRKDNDMAINLIARVNKFAIDSEKHMINLAHKSMQERVSDMLLYLANDIYKSDAFNTTLTRQEMADICSLSKESVIRILKSFKDDKIIELNSNNISILDKPKLVSISKSIMH